MSGRRIITRRSAELSGAIQRMALLQALPDLPAGEDEEEDAALSVLAQQFAPEDLQLLYQIAITSRRDLDYAPDARAGFEMALLRMLAFRPQAVATGAALEATPATTRSNVARAAMPAATKSAPVTAVAPRPPHRALSQAHVRAESDRRTAHSGVQPLPAQSTGAQAAGALGKDWAEIVASLGCQGPLRQLAAHCLLVERKQGVVRLRLDADGESFRRPQLEQKLAAALSNYFGETVRLEFLPATTSATPVIVTEELTPARREARAAEERQRAAEQAIDNDPAVRALREVFGATVKPGSVKPRN